MLSIRTILPKLFSIALICLGFSVNAQFHDGLLVEYGKNEYNTEILNGSITLRANLRYTTTRVARLWLGIL